VFSVGITWTQKQKNIIVNLSPFDIEVCKIDFEFEFANEDTIYYTRRIPENLLFVDFGMLNISSPTFQIYNVPMFFDSVDFNWFSSKMVRS
jgi:hypothetical protein